MKLSQHAKDKLTIYEVSEEILWDALKRILYICRDYKKKSLIYVVQIEGKIFSVVVKDNIIITVYRTDLNKLNSRIKSGRWDCQSCC